MFNILFSSPFFSREECCLVHASDFWSRWEESESMTEEERETLAKTYHCIYLNKESVRCARLVKAADLLKTPLFTDWRPGECSSVWTE